MDRGGTGTPQQIEETDGAVTEEDFSLLFDLGTALDYEPAIDPVTTEPATPERLQFNHLVQDPLIPLATTPLTVAIKNNENIDVIIALINAGEPIDARNRQGMTPLMLAARYNDNPELITALIKAGAAVNAQCDRYQRTPLIYAAAFASNPEVITALISAGADTEARDALRYTAREYARINETIKRTRAFKSLFDRGIGLKRYLPSIYSERSLNEETTETVSTDTVNAESVP